MLLMNSWISCAVSEPEGLFGFMKQMPIKKGRTLVVGSKCYGEKQDRRDLYKNAIGIDLEDGEGVDFIHNLEKPLPASAGKFDHVDCVSVLEHVRRPWMLAKNIESALVSGGTLLVCLPFVWRVHSYPGDYWRMTIQAMPVLFPRIGWLHNGYLVNGEVRKIVHGKNDEEGKWMQRAEMVAFGVRA